MARFRDDWGKGGNGVRLSKKEQELADKEFSKAGFNVYVSDRIPLNRTLMDPRVDPCRTRSYPEDLPSVSVIITFYNEILSALLRTIVSVVNRSPVRILREVVLVDDFSNMTELKGQLYRFLRRRFRPGFIKLLRLPRREGLIRARLAGASAAQGHIIVFLDSHCEATEGWLEPLVDVVNDDPTTIASPIITVIDEHSFTVQVSCICRYVPSGIVTSRDVELHALQRRVLEIVECSDLAYPYTLDAITQLVALFHHLVVPVYTEHPHSSRTPNAITLMLLFHTTPILTLARRLTR